MSIATTLLNLLPLPPSLLHVLTDQLHLSRIQDQSSSQAALKNLSGRNLRRGYNAKVIAGGAVGASHAH